MGRWKKRSLRGLRTIRDGRDQEREMEKIRRRKKKEGREVGRRKSDYLKTKSFNHLTFIVIKTYYVLGTILLCLGLEIEMKKTYGDL